MATIKEKVGAYMRAYASHVASVSVQFSITCTTSQDPSIVHQDSISMPRSSVISSLHRNWLIAGEVTEKIGKAFTDTGKVGKKFNPDHPEGTLGRTT